MLDPFWAVVGIAVVVHCTEISLNLLQLAVTNPSDASTPFEARFVRTVQELGEIRTNLLSPALTPHSETEDELRGPFEKYRTIEQNIQRGTSGPHARQNGTATAGLQPQNAALASFIGATSTELDRIRHDFICAVFRRIWHDLGGPQLEILNFSDHVNDMLCILDEVEMRIIHVQDSVRSSAPDEQRLELANSICDTLRVSECSVTMGFQSKPNDLLVRGFTAIINAIDMVGPCRIQNGISLALRTLVEDTREAKQFVDPLWSMEVERVSTTALAGHPHVHGDPRGSWQDIAAQLHSKDLDKRGNQIKDPWQGTFDWIHHQPATGNGNPDQTIFEWLENSSASIFWLSGKPGSGKSTMMKYIIQSMETIARLRRDPPSLDALILHFYAWRLGTNLQSSIEGLKQTVLHQALCSRPDLLPKIAPRRYIFARTFQCPLRPNYPPWEVEEINESFELLISLHGTEFRLVIFIDGLDEINAKQNKIGDLIDLLKHRSVVSEDGSRQGQSVRATIHNAPVSDITEAAPVLEPIKICVSSRPWVHLSGNFEVDLRLAMEQFTGPDIGTFFGNHFPRNHRYRDNDVRDIISDTVSDSRGCFKWASLVVGHLQSHLANADKMKDITRRRHDYCPPEMSAMYKDIWDTIPREGRPKVAKWIRLLEIANESLPWLEVFVADEAFLDSNVVMKFYTVSDGDKASEEFFEARVTAYSHGLLDFTTGDNKLVDFMQNTGRMWVKGDEIQSSLRSFQGTDFDPYIILFYAAVSSFAVTKFPGRKDLDTALCRVLSYASLVKPEDQEKTFFITALDKLERSAILFDLQLKHGSSTRADGRAIGAQNIINITADMVTAALDSIIVEDGLNESDDDDEYSGGFRATFFALTTYFSIVPYVRKKLHGEKKLLKKPNLVGTGLLAGAILGPRYALPNIMKDVGLKPPLLFENRRDIVKLLLKTNVDLKDRLQLVRGQNNGSINVYKEVEKKWEQTPRSQVHDAERLYYREMCELLPKDVRERKEESRGIFRRIFRR